MTAAAAFAAAPQRSLLAIGALMFLGGMAAASANTAGGRLVSGSFPSHQRAWRWEFVRLRNRWALRSAR
ncbi:hypothetical protein I547_7688 [Mycobacterium kansasii 824]|nr:hypothetical protein I547_7688 [Mycobacterium kansasii 824]